MKTKIRRRVITETRQVAVISNSTSPANFFCQLCDEPSKMVTPLTAARLKKISTRDIYKSIENGKTHFVELEDKQIFVCLRSI